MFHRLKYLIYIFPVENLIQIKNLHYHQILSWRIIFIIVNVLFIIFYERMKM